MKSSMRWLALVLVAMLLPVGALAADVGAIINRTEPMDEAMLRQRTMDLVAAIEGGGADKHAGFVGAAVEASPEYEALVAQAQGEGVDASTLTYHYLRGGQNGGMSSKESAYVLVDGKWLTFEEIGSMFEALMDDGVKALQEKYNLTEAELQQLFSEAVEGDGYYNAMMDFLGEASNWTTNGAAESTVIGAVNDLFDALDAYIEGKLPT